MPRQFTSAVCTKGLMFAALLMLGACSSVPMPFAGKDKAAPERVEGAAMSTAVDAQDADGVATVPVNPIQVVPTPPLQPGSQALFDRALELLRDEQYQAAEVLFLELTSSQPELAGPWVNLGHVYLAQTRNEEAQEAFQQALQANPKNCDALNQLGVIARRAGRFTEAEQFYLSCLQANPGYHHARLNLGILYELYMGRLGEALATYHDYQALLPQPDTRVDGWVMDLERRVASVARR